MVAGGQLAHAKGALAQLLAQAYRQRDRVALIGLGGSGIACWQAAGAASSRPENLLATIGGGGGTPLAAALARADALLARHAQGPRCLWLLTDGRTRELPPRPRHAEQLRVLDFDAARVPLGRCVELATLWGAELLHASQLSA